MDSLPDLRTLSLQRMTERLILIVEDGRIKKTARDAVFVIAENAILNYGESETRAEFIKNRFVSAMKNSNPEYVSAIMDSLSSVMEACIDDEIYQPILQKSFGREVKR